MADYIVTGKKGAGKSLVAVGIIRDALQAGLPVATNIDLNMEYLLPWRVKNSRVFRLPDKLSAESFQIIGSGNDTEEEDLNGIIVLDEGGLSMNSRDYRESGRKEFIQWGIHSRKHGWHMYILIQHVDGIDKQIRDFFGEHIVICSRMDRIRLPFVGWLLQIFGFKATLPRFHKATCRYGQDKRGPVSWRKWFRGADLYKAYSTRQIFDPHDASGVRSVLSPWHVMGRHYDDFEQYKIFFKHIWEQYINVKMGRLFVFFCAALLGGWVNASFNSADPIPVAAALASSESVIVETPGQLSDILIEDELEPFDPWFTASISSYLGNVKTMQFKYRFRDYDGFPLYPENDWQVVSVTPCTALVKSPNVTYRVYCD